MTIRPIETRDRQQVAALLGDARPLDSPSHHIHVACEGSRVHDVSLWAEQGNDTPVLAAVITAPVEPFEPSLTTKPLTVLCQLAAAAAQDALERSFSAGRFTIKSAALLRRLQRVFRIDAKASGWQPATGKPVEWEITVDLKDALGQLEPYLSRVG